MSDVDRSTGAVRRDVYAVAEEALGRRLGEIERLRREICRLQAEQAEEITGFIDARLSADAELNFVDTPSANRSMIAEVAVAAGVSVITAQGLMSDAWQLVTHNPATLAALRAGDVQPWVARTIAAETGLIEDPRLRTLADRVIAEEAVDVLPGKARTLAQRRVLEVDPDAAARRAETARREAHVTAHSDTPGVGTLTARMEAERVAACADALRAEATARKAAGTPGRLGQLMCQVLFERLTGAEQVTDLKAQISVVMTDTTLFGHDDTPANLLGHGPLPAHVARMLATHDNAWLRRFYTDPIDGAVTAADTRRRKFDGSLRAVATVRDQHCRGINCAAPITEHDHIEDHADGGPTSFGNDQGLSGGCHAAKSHPQMTVRKDRDTCVTTWRTPSGLVHHNLPPPALGHGSLPPDQMRFRRLLLHPPDSALESRLLRDVVRHTRQGRARALSVTVRHIRGHPHSAGRVDGLESDTERADPATTPAPPDGEPPRF